MRWGSPNGIVAEQLINFINMKFWLKLVTSISVLFLFFAFLGCENNSDKLAGSLSKINNYLKERDSISKGAFFDYIKNNPKYTVEEIEQKGFIDKSYILKEKNIIEKAISNMEGKEILEIAKKVMDPEFISTDENPGNGGFRFVIWRCNGCLDFIRHNHCITLMGYEMGPGC